MLCSLLESWLSGELLEHAAVVLSWYCNYNDFSITSALVC